MRKLLISAFGCWPGRGSELGVGWEWCKQLAYDNELHIITISRSQKDIEKHRDLLEPEVSKNMHFYYFDYSKYIMKFFPAGTSRWYFYYFIWQIGILKIAYKLSKKIKFDYSMHLTFGSVWLPCFISLLKIPFIWGPWGGCDTIPENYKMISNSKKHSILSWAQSKRSWLVRHAYTIPFIKYNMDKACAILVRTNNNYDAVPQKYHYKTHLILETAMEPFPISDIPKNKTTENIKIVTTGRLISSKNLKTAIEAIALVYPQKTVSYDIIGDGPERQLLSKLIEEKGLSDVIHLQKSIDRSLLLKKLPQYDVYLFPSLLEGGSWALMEAMGCALPIICYNNAGMSTITNDTCAIRLSISDPVSTISEMADAILYLIENPSIRKRFGENARLRILNDFNWGTKRIFMNNLFNHLNSNANA